jgi:NADH:ubiquinone oxidoreductase subunit 5 (subunit L)/multisubunit Na+/H+ antiporter MnhA subunit
MTFGLKLFILIPLAGFVLNLCLPAKNERAISWVAYTTAGLHHAMFLVFTAYWIWQGSPTLNLKEIVVLKASGYEFFIDFYFDKITAVYLMVGSFLTFLVAVYSRSYLHREKGYKRFFNTILFFYFGYNIVIFSGNLETLFMGWEILGISSFLLIAFYRNRYLPVKNAVKVFSIYRIGDVGIILAMWMSHHLWNENITFLKLSNYELVSSQLQADSLVGIFISLMILLSAVAKSAQFPFSFWLPRAMEGPTPSSAIFYGALSVHVGIYILLRTFPFWEHQVSVRILIGMIGLVTSIIATGIARVQSSVKSQIAYSSIAQIGIIFIEVAAGFENLALWHFAGNAFLRTYQLLVSPSIVTYLIREQFYNFIPKKRAEGSWLPKKLELTFYMLCLKEWGLDSLTYRYLWNPLKHIGRRLGFLSFNGILYFFIPAYLLGLFFAYNKHLVSEQIQSYLPLFFSLIGLTMVIKSFVERRLALLSWVLIIMSHFWIALAIAFNEQFEFNQVHLYLSGIAISGIVGIVCLRWLAMQENESGLEKFHGNSYRHPKAGFVFLLACLGVAGFPISPTFIGEDLIMTHVHPDQVLLASIIAVSFIVDGLSLIRIYARIFLGPHAKSMYEMAYKSS